VTAEGVETEQQLEWLVAEGPVEVQGYLLSRPVRAEAVPALIEAQAHRVAQAGLNA
jgi:EAL domain-containing protein (putative c-di-GMP-specific phosphodiesterase class I)